MRRARFRQPHGPGWRVRARVERFSEPALLLLLRDRPAHGYELVEGLRGMLPGEQVDLGNVYRALRALEEEGFVESEWRADAPGPAKRVYRLTRAGTGLLEQWAEALEHARRRIDAFLTTYRERG